MTTYISFKNGVYYTAGKLKKSMPQLKAIKEKNGVLLYPITLSQWKDLQVGYTASELAGVVSVMEPVGWLKKYKKDKIREQLNIAKRMLLDKEFEKPDNYKTNMKNYYTNIAKASINLSSDEKDVNSAVSALDWGSV